MSRFGIDLRIPDKPFAGATRMPLISLAGAAVDGSGRIIFAGTLDDGPNGSGPRPDSLLRNGFN